MKNQIFSFISIILIAFACSGEQNAKTGKEVNSSSTPDETDRKKANIEVNDTATFAGGCFWCVEAVFERVVGVDEVVSGYSGGNKSTASYKLVSYGKTKHAESVQIYYDSTIISFKELLMIFMGTHEPTQLNRQGPDIGSQYRSAVFYDDKRQRKITEAYIEYLEKENKYEKPIVTKISRLDGFYKAEEYHQNYYEDNPNDRYIQQIAVPKVKKFRKKFGQYLKTEYR